MMPSMGGFFLNHYEARPVASNRGRKRLRRALFEKQGGLCAYCDHPMALGSFDGRMASFDHVRPVADGGEFDESNLVLSCWQCNRLKGSLTPDEMRRLADRIERLTRSTASDGG